MASTSPEPQASIQPLEELSSGASSILSLMFFFDPKCIQEEVFKFESPAPKLRDFPQSKLAYERDLTELQQSSLIVRNEDHTEFAVCLGVRDLIRSTLLKLPSRFTEVFYVVVELLSASWPFVTKPEGLSQDYDVVKRFPQCEKMLPHIKRMKRIFESVGSNQKQKCATSEFARLMVDVACIHKDCVNAKECLQFLRAAHTVLDFSHENIRPIMAELRDISGSINLEINEFQTALAHQKEHVRLRESEFARTQIPTKKLAIAYDSLGCALMANGLFDQAAEAYKKSVEIRTELPDFKKVDLFNALTGHGLISWRRDHDCTKAVEYFQEVLHDREEEYGKNDTLCPRTGLVLYYIGTVRQSENCWFEALTYQQRALPRFLATVGPEHTLTARTYYKLSQNWIHLGAYADALEYLSNAERVFTKPDYYMRDLARCKYRTGQVLQMAGRDEDAFEEEARAYELRKALVPGDARGIGEMVEADYDELVAFWTV